MQYRTLTSIRYIALFIYIVFYMLLIISIRCVYSTLARRTSVGKACSRGRRAVSANEKETRGGARCRCNEGGSEDCVIVWWSLMCNIIIFKFCNNDNRIIIIILHYLLLLYYLLTYLAT